jgi:transposase InsO family protein
MSAALREQGFDVGRCQARSLMREAGVQARYKRKFRVTTNSKHKQPIFENKLNRDFDPASPNSVWASDITYVRTCEGWLYLNVVIDLYSRKVVGWSLKPRLNSDLATDALRMAYQQRQPAKGLMHHSDRGVQYASRDFRSMLFGYRMKGSMSRKGNCWDSRQCSALASEVWICQMRVLKAFSVR